MKKILVAFLIAISFSLAKAEPVSVVLERSGTPITVQGVSVYPDVKVQTADGPVALKLTGAGVYRKLSFVKVMVAASYVADPAAFRELAQTDLMDAVASQKVRLLDLTMLRSLSAAEIRQSFEEGLADYNGVDIGTPTWQSLFDQFNFAIGAGNNAVFLGYPEGAAEKLTIEAMGKTVVEEAPDLALDFWKIFFGKGDSGILAMQKDLVGR